MEGGGGGGGGDGGGDGGGCVCVWGGRVWVRARARGACVRACVCCVCVCVMFSLSFASRQEYLNKKIQPVTIAGFARAHTIYRPAYTLVQQRKSELYRTCVRLSMCTCSVHDRCLVDIGTGDGVHVITRKLCQTSKETIAMVILVAQNGLSKEYGLTVISGHCKSVMSSSELAGYLYTNTNTRLHTAEAEEFPLNDCSE